MSENLSYRVIDHGFPGLFTDISKLIRILLFSFPTF